LPNFAKTGHSVAVIYRFSDFRDGGRRHLGFSKIRNFKQALHCEQHICVIVPNFIKIGQAIQRFSKWRQSAILEFGHSNLLTVQTIKRRMLYNRASVREARPIHYSDMAIFVVFKMAAPPSWIFKNSKF